MATDRIPCVNPAAHRVSYHVAGSREAVLCRPTTSVDTRFVPGVRSSLPSTSRESILVSLNTNDFVDRRVVAHNVDPHNSVAVFAELEAMRRDGLVEVRGSGDGRAYRITRAGSDQAGWTYVQRRWVVSSHLNEEKIRLRTGFDLESYKERERGAVGAVAGTPGTGIVAGTVGQDSRDNGVRAEDPVMVRYRHHPTVTGGMWDVQVGGKDYDAVQDVHREFRNTLIDASGNRVNDLEEMSRGKKVWVWTQVAAGSVVRALGKPFISLIGKIIEKKAVG